MSGFGKLFYPNGKLAYEGEWKNNAFNGKGKIFNEEPTEMQEDFDYRNFDFLKDGWLKY
jgi:antitoxin component YwqK of YwqJK toxin-antitoxin module